MEDTIFKLQKYSNLFHTNNMVAWMLRYLAWNLVKVLSTLLNTAQGLVDKILSLNNFFYDEKLQGFINNFKPILYLILAISIILIGYQLIIGKKDGLSNLITNFLVALCVIILLPSFMTKLNDLALSSVKATTGSAETSTLSNNIIKDNVIDLFVYDAANFDETKIKDKNNISEKQILNIDINEMIENNFNSSTDKELFRKRIQIDGDGNATLVDLADSYILGNISSLMKGNYYRFSVNFYTIIITLLVLSATFILTSIKLARIIFDLAFYKFFATIVAFADLSGGQRIKEIIKTIVNSYLVIFFISILFKIYMIFTTWAVNNSSGVVYLILMIAGSIAVIDGPDIIERILGIDAGVKSGYGTFKRTYAAGKLAKTAAVLGTGAVLTSARNTARNVAVPIAKGIETVSDIVFPKRARTRRKR